MSERHLMMLHPVVVGGVAGGATPRRMNLRSALLLAPLLATAIALVWVWTTAPFSFEVFVQSSTGGDAQLYFDVGRGLNEADSARLPLETGDGFHRYRFPMPAGTIRSLRFDPTDHGGGRQRLRQARLVDRAGGVIREFSPAGFLAAQQIEGLRADAAGLQIETLPGSNDPVLAVPLADQLVLEPTRGASTLLFLRVFAAWFAALVLSCLGAPRLAAWWRGTAVLRLERPAGWVRRHPAGTIALTAALATVASCYPVVFFGKSFVSPNNHSGTFLLYNRMPTLPGYDDPTTDDEKGSDLGAMMWYDWPTSVVESGALRHDRELPLWNRFNSAGLPLLGQGQSMLGDPLHGLVLLMGATGGWWDVKFVVAKWFFAACVGGTIWLACRHLGAAALLAASAPFLGFFSYRYSHPGFFSLCYAPAVLHCWLRLTTAGTRREVATALALLLGANWLLLCSGTVKEAYMQLLGMNLAGTLALLLTPSPGRVKGQKLGGAVLTGLLFVGISAPLWWSFLRALGSSRTAYETGGVFQLQPGLLVGLFDDIFYRQFNDAETHLDPSANFLVLLGVAWFAARRALGGRFDGPAGALTLCAVGAGALVFGVVPAGWILRVPFIRQIIHVDNTFSCVLIVYLLVLAGYGVRDFCGVAAASSAAGGRKFARTYGLAIFGVLGLLGAYLGTAHAAQRSSRALLHVGEQIALSPFFVGYALTLTLGAALLPWLGRRLLAAGRTEPWPLLGCLAVGALLHWRHGMHLPTRFDPYVMNPHARVDLFARSAALDAVRARLTAPARCVGFGSTFFPGYGSAAGLESIDGPDALFNPAYRDLMQAAGFPLVYGIWRFGVDAQTFRGELPALNLLNVRYYLDDARAETGDADLRPLKRVAALDLKVYESEGAWPRAFFVDRFVAYPGGADEFAALLKNGDGSPFVALRPEELATRPVLAPLRGEGGVGARRVVPAARYRQTANATEVEVAAPGPGILTLTETFVDGDVQALVNGRPADCFRVNHAFRGVYLEGPGRYQVSFRYWPRHYGLVLWASAASLAAAVALWWRARAPISRPTPN